MPEPIKMEEIRRHLGILDGFNDEVLETHMVEARAAIEEYTGLVLTRRVVTQAVPCFSHPLRAWPIVSVDAVSYIDVDGQDAELDAADYRAQIARRPARLLASAWPTIYPGTAILVECTAGFADYAAILAGAPNVIRALKQFVAAFNDDRETGGLAGEVEAAMRTLCRRYRLPTA